MIVCLCHRASDRDIARVARDGRASFDALQDEPRVAADCGASRKCAHATFEQHRSSATPGVRPRAAEPAWGAA